MWMGVLLTCVFVYYLYAWCPGRPEEGIGWLWVIMWALEITTYTYIKL